MTNVKLGDASIRITLDPESAKREADALKRELEKIEERKKKVAEEMERAARGEQSPTAPKPDPNVPGSGQHGRRTSHAAIGGGDDEAGKGSSKGSRRGIRQFLDLAVMGAKIAAATSKKLAASADMFESKFKGSMFEGVAKRGAGVVKDIAGGVIKAESHLSAVPDTLTDVLDYNTAALKLGGKFPEDQDKLISDFYRINQAQEELRKSFSLATEQLMLEYVERGMSAVIESAIKKATNQ